MSKMICTAILYKASTGPEQGFPCVVFPHRENPVFIRGSQVMKQVFPCEKKLHRENHIFITGMGLQGGPDQNDLDLTKTVWT